MEAFASHNSRRASSTFATGLTSWAGLVAHAATVAVVVSLVVARHVAVVAIAAAVIVAYAATVIVAYAAAVFFAFAAAFATSNTAIIATVIASLVVALVIVAAAAVARFHRRYHQHFLFHNAGVNQWPVEDSVNMMTTKMETKKMREMIMTTMDPMQRTCW